MRFKILAGLAFSILLGSDASAAATVALHNTPKIKLGHTGQFKVSGKALIPNTSITYPGYQTWEYRQNDDCVSNWIPFDNQTGEVVTITFGIPGTFELRCNVIYAQVPMTVKPQNESPTLTYTVPEPDAGSALLTELVDVDVDYNNGIYEPNRLEVNAECDGLWLAFHLTAGGEEIGPHHGLVAEEKLTNRHHPFAIETHPDPSEWEPVTKPDARFFLGMTPDPKLVIWDFKFVTAPFAGPYAHDENGDPTLIMSYTQTNRVVWKDFCNNSHNKEVGVYNFVRQTSSDTTFEIICTIPEP